MIYDIWYMKEYMMYVKCMIYENTWVMTDVPIFHITQPWMVFVVNAMATFSGDVQYSQNGRVTNPEIDDARIW